MQHQPTHEPGPAEAEDTLQQALLGLLLAYPRQMTFDEVARELGDPRPLIEDAARALVAAGLAHRHGPFLAPTRAAVRFEELDL